MTKLPLVYFGGPKQQQGAAALFLAISLVAIMTAIGFALELGQIYASKVELRKRAEIAALDAAMAAGGCANPDSADARVALANQSAKNSLKRLGDDTLKLEQVELGIEYTEGHIRRFAASPTATNASAVAVTLSRPLPDPIVPMLPRREGAKLTAKAAASRSPLVSFTSTPYTINARPLGGDPLEKIIPPLLGGNFGINGPALAALIGSSVELQELVDAAGVETISELLIEPVTVPGMLSVLASALLNAGEALAASAVDAVAAAAPATMAIPFAERAGLPSDIPAVATALRVQSFDLLRSAVFSATPVFSITPDIEIPGVGSVLADIVVLSPPASQSGSLIRDEEGNMARTAESSQVGLGLAVELLPALSNVANVSLDLQLDVGKVAATLADLHCATADDTRSLVTIAATPSLASLGVSATVTILGIDLELVLNDVNGPIQLGCDVPAYREFEAPFPSETWNVAATSCPPGSNALVGGLLSSLVAGGVKVNLEGVPVVSQVALGPVVTAIEPLLAGALTPILNRLEEDLLYPLLGMLGVSLGGGEVLVTDYIVPQPALIQAN